MKITISIPREIGEYIKYCKGKGLTCYGALDPVNKFGEPLCDDFKGDVNKCAKWARTNS